MCFLLFLVVSLALYYVATQVVLRLKDVRLGDYAGSRVNFRLSSVPAGIAQAYGTFFAFFTQGKAGLMPTVFSRWMHGIGIVATVVLLVLWGTTHRQPGRLLLLAALVAMLPLAVNCMYLFTVPESIHTLVLYGFVSVYVLMILAADICLSVPGKAWDLLRRFGLNAVAVPPPRFIQTLDAKANGLDAQLHCVCQRLCRDIFLILKQF